VPILSLLDPIHALTSHILKIHFNIILPFTHGSPEWSLSLRFPHQNTIRLFSHPYALHASPISFFSIWLPEQHWMRSTDHKAPHVVFSTPLLSRPFWAHIFSTPYFQTPSTQQNYYWHKNNFTETDFYLILTILNKKILIEHDFFPRVLLGRCWV